MDPQFESPHASIESEIQKLSEELGMRAEKKEGNHKEAVREALKERVYTHTPTAPETIPASPSGGPRTGNSTVLPSYLEDAPTGIKLKVEQLVDMAYHKGIMAAVGEARKGGALVLDAFHDALTDRVYEDLKKRGIIK